MDQRQHKRFTHNRERYDRKWQRNNRRAHFGAPAAHYRNPFNNRKPANSAQELNWTHALPSISYAFNNSTNRRALKSPIMQHSKNSDVEEEDWDKEEVDEKPKTSCNLDERVAASTSATKTSNSARAKTCDRFADAEPVVSTAAATQQDKVMKKADQQTAANAVDKVSAKQLDDARRQEKNKLKQKTSQAAPADNDVSEMWSRQEDNLQDWDLNEKSNENENVNNTLLCTAVSEFLRGSKSLTDAQANCSKIVHSATTTKTTEVATAATTTTISTSITSVPTPTCAFMPAFKSLDEIATKTAEKPFDKIQQQSTTEAELQQQHKTQAATKSKPIANDFDVLSISEIHAEEAVKRQQQEEQQQTNKTTTFDENEKCIMELLPNVSKDFKKLKTLDNNLQRIQKMRISLGDIDDICDDLIKMEKLLMQEKNLILQKYAKSDNDLLANTMHLLPKSTAKKLKKANKLITESTSPTTDTAEANDNKNKTVETIKLTISPIKLTPKLIKRTTVPKLFHDDDDDDDNESDDTKKTENVSTKTATQTTTKTVAIVKPIMENKHASNKHITENEVVSRRRRSRSNSRRRTPRREESYSRHYQRSHSRSISVTRCDSQQRSSTRNFRRKDYFRVPRSRSRGRRSPVGRESVSPNWSPSPQPAASDRRTRSPQSHDGRRHFNPRSPPMTSSPLTHDNRRHFTPRSPHTPRSNSPHFHPRSPPASSSPLQHDKHSSFNARSPLRRERSLTPNSSHDSPSSSRSWTPERHIDKSRPTLYADNKYERKRSSYLLDNQDANLHAQTQYYAYDNASTYDNAAATSNDAYYYNATQHMLPAETLPPLPIIPRTTNYNYNNMEAPYVPVDFPMVPPASIWPVDMSLPPPNFFPAAPISMQQNAVTKQPAVAIQKGNVLEIVLQQSSEAALQYETKANDKENIHAETASITTATSTDLPAQTSKKSINMKWAEEVEQRRKQAILLSQNRAKQSILKTQKESNINELAQQQQPKSKQLKKKKKVFFVDGIYPSHDSSDEDNKAVVETLKVKVQRLRKRYGDEQVETARQLVAKLEIEKLAEELDKLPAPPPPAGLPSAELEQPIYLRPLSPDVYQFYHYDPEVHSMYISSYEHALPPRLLCAKKHKSTNANKNMSAAAPNQSALPNHNSIKQHALPAALPTLPTALSAGVAMPFPTLPCRAAELPNEFVTQPLYPSSKGRDPRIRNPLPFFQLPTPTHIAPLQRKPATNVNPIAAVTATVRNNMHTTTSHFSEKSNI